MIPYSRGQNSKSVSLDEIGIDLTQKNTAQDFKDDKKEYIA